LFSRITAGPHTCYINAGVYLLDLRAYAAARIPERITALYEAHARAQLWVVGVQQPPFILALYNHTMTIDPRWNVKVRIVFQLSSA
jgi:hypothetical protein